MTYVMAFRIRILLILLEKQNVSGARGSQATRLTPLTDGLACKVLLARKACRHGHSPVSCCLLWGWCLLELIAKHAGQPGPKRARCLCLAHLWPPSDYGLLSEDQPLS